MLSAHVWLPSPIRHRLQGKPSRIPDLLQEVLPQLQSPDLQGEHDRLQRVHSVEHERFHNYSRHECHD